MSDLKFLSDAEQSFAKTPAGIAALQKATAEYTRRSRFGDGPAYAMIVQDCVRAAMSSEARRNVTVDANNRYIDTTNRNRDILRRGLQSI